MVFLQPGAVLGFAGNVTFNNQGILTMFDSSLMTGSGTNAFNNSGTFVRQSQTTPGSPDQQEQTPPTTSLLLGIPFNNTGYVRIDNGTLILQGGGISTGQWIIGSTATLIFNSAYR
jgi:hypothetical protein